MTPILLMLTAVGLLVLSARKSAAVSSASTPQQNADPRIAQALAQIESDYKFYEDSVTSQTDANLRCGNTKLTGDVYCGNPSSNNVPSQKEIQYLSNAIEWAGKCQRDGGVCKTKAITKGISDNSIISTSQNILTAVIVKRYPSASAEQQADIFMRTIKETVVDVKNLQWVAFIPYVALILAPLTAGFAVAGAAATFGTIQGAILGSLSVTLPAGITTASSISQVVGGGQSGQEKDIRKQLTETFAYLKEIMK